MAAVFGTNGGKRFKMPYFNYHATAKRLIREGRLTGFRFVPEYRGISPALLLFFDDPRHPVMPIREHRFSEYLTLLSGEGTEGGAAPIDNR